MKPLIVGEAPSKNEPLPRPIEGRIGYRLAACCGVPFEEFLTIFDRMNLLDVRQDTAEHGFTFDAIAARERARITWQNLELGRVVILLGQRVATAFELKSDYFLAQEKHGVKTYVVPHPSGINRWWNDPEHEQRMVAFMRQIVAEARR